MYYYAVSKKEKKTYNTLKTEILRQFSIFIFFSYKFATPPSWKTILPPPLFGPSNSLAPVWPLKTFWPHSDYPNNFCPHNQANLLVKKR